MQDKDLSIYGIKQVKFALLGANPQGPTIPLTLNGTVAGTNDQGVLIKASTGKSVFIPWSSIQYITD